MGNKDWFADSGIIALDSADQGFEGIHYFQSMHLHKETFGVIVQANVESITGNYENIGAVVSSEIKQLRKSPSKKVLRKI